MLSRIDLLHLLLLFCFYLRAVDCVCYPAPSYQAIAGKYSCRLLQVNWASESYFEVVYKHCLEEPTVHVFIRNFYGFDEINMDFNKKESFLLATSYAGKLGMIQFAFTTFKANPALDIKEQIQVKLIFYPAFVKSDSERLLTAVFPNHDKSDCTWVEKLPLHNKIFFALGLTFGFVFIIVIAVIYCYRRYTSSHHHPAPVPRFEPKPL